MLHPTLPLKDADAFIFRFRFGQLFRASSLAVSAIVDWVGLSLSASKSRAHVANPMTSQQTGCQELNDRGRDKQLFVLSSIYPRCLASAPY